MKRFLLEEARIYSAHKMDDLVDLKYQVFRDQPGKFHWSMISVAFATMSSESRNLNGTGNIGEGDNNKSVHNDIFMSMLLYYQNIFHGPVWIGIVR